MTETELRERLKDPNFAIGFLLDNNYEAVQEKLAEIGYNVSSKEQAAAVIKQLAYNRNTSALDSVFNVPYINDKRNGTGGYRNLFLLNSQPPSAQEKGEAIREAATAAADGGSIVSSTNSPNPLWSGVMSFLTGGLGAIFGPRPTATPPLTPQQIAAQQEAAKKAEEEAKRKERNVLLAIGGSVLIIVIFAIIIAVTKSNK